MDAIFDGVWVKDSQGTIRNIGKPSANPGHDGRGGQRENLRSEIKSLLQNNGEEAIDAGVLGLTMLIGDKLFGEMIVVRC